MPKRFEVHTLSTDFRRATRLVEDPDIPEASPHLVVVKNHYVGINATDINVTNGSYTNEPLPFGCGVEGELGAFAEYVAVPAQALVQRDTTEQGVLTMLVSGTSASLALEEVSQVKSGEIVLVTAAAGGTGQFVVELAKRAGNHVIGTCSSDEKAAYLTQLGYDRVVNYKKEDLSSVLQDEYPNGVDLIFESVGGVLFQAALKNLAVHGRMIFFGFISEHQRRGLHGTSSGKECPMSVHHVTAVLLAKSASLRGFYAPNHSAHYKDHVQKLLALIIAGVDKHVFHGLESVPKAIDYMYAHKNMGKIAVQLEG